MHCTHTFSIHCWFFTWGALIVVKWSKTIQFGERTVCIPCPYIVGSLHYPLLALLHSMSFTAACATSHATTDSHAFPCLDYDSLNLKCFTYSFFVNKLGQCLSSRGLSCNLYVEHSVRRGGTSHAFQDGVLILVELIKMLGDWKSDSAKLHCSPSGQTYNDYQSHLQINSLSTFHLRFGALCRYSMSHFCIMLFNQDSFVMYVVYLYLVCRINVCPKLYI